jgi:metal-responsive CopG/Arc/MetJ family transcriptional regulator
MNERQRPYNQELTATVLFRVSHDFYAMIQKAMRNHGYTRMSDFMRDAVRYFVERADTADPGRSSDVEC